jgi:hypothetical protein
MASEFWIVMADHARWLALLPICYFTMVLGQRNRGREGNGTGTVGREVKATTSVGRGETVAD